MSKQMIVEQIIAKLNQLGVTLQVANKTDITIETEFLDSGWSTGSKKITYQASIYADETTQTVFMWEMTKEVGHGLSFGGESGSSFQSGTTLFRKVKSVQYGPEGKVYEVTLDLGAIPKAAKEAAKQYGWKFKTVIKKEKALWPAGYIPAGINNTAAKQPQGELEKVEGGQFCTNCGNKLDQKVQFCPECGTPKQVENKQPLEQKSQMNDDTQPLEQKNQQLNQQANEMNTQQTLKENLFNNPQNPLYSNAPQKKSSKSGTFGLIGFIVLGIIMAIFLAALKSSAIGWVITAIVFAMAFIMQRKITQKGCLLNLGIWILTAVILFITVAVTSTSESASFTTANLKQAHMTSAMDKNGKPTDKVNTYAVNAPELVAVAELHNAPSNTKVKFVWTYVTGSIPITEYNMDSGNKGASVYVFSNLTNDKPWPKGEYKVDMYIEDRKTPDATVKFTVGEAAATNATAGNNVAAIDPSVDNIDMTAYFQKILDRVKKEWKSDAKMISIRLNRNDEKNFNALNRLRVDSDWMIIFYSLSSTTEAAVYLENATKDAEGLPTMRYRVVDNNSGNSMNQTFAEMKKNGAKISEYSRPETAKINEKVPDNCIAGSKIKMSEIIQLLSERVKNEKPLEKGYNITMNGINGPKLDIYWLSGTTPNRFYIDLDTKKAYDKQ